jgi:hypothetical protein
MDMDAILSLVLLDLQIFFLLCILQLSLFLHNSNFFRQPSSLLVQRRFQSDCRIDGICLGVYEGKCKVAPKNSLWPPAVQARLPRFT